LKVATPLEADAPPFGAPQSLGTDTPPLRALRLPGAEPPLLEASQSLEVDTPRPGVPRLLGGGSTDAETCTVVGSRYQVLRGERPGRNYISEIQSGEYAHVLP